MKTLDASLSAALSAENSVLCFLLSFTVASTTYRYTDANVDLFYNGNTYTSYGLEPEAIGLSVSEGQDSINIQIDNAALEMAAIVLNDDALGGAVDLYLACVSDTTKLITAAENMFSGKISSWSMTNNMLRLETVNDLVWWNKRTLRQTTGDCRWDFKGTECGYVGAATRCDRSYANCTALSNTDSFGGFRFLPAVQEADIWWGRTFANIDPNARTHK